ncbi:MAG: DUF5107 domain-containing protein [Thermoguttaceae bacterium]|jgi:tetratricopeptide (TPR) repeat protein
MKVRTQILVLIAVLSAAAASSAARAEVRAWEGAITIPTYPWEDDVNPKFWALERGATLSTTVETSIIYPYVMQDHLSRTKVDRTYKALFLENEYLRVTCLPELGGRLYSVLDKTQGREMFHLNRVIKPGMIALRGAFISGGVEWNAGPHGHTVTVVAPVDALAGRDPDGSAWLEIGNQEQIFRTRWTVRVTLHPGRAQLDERICLANPTDSPQPYYFWNCTAFPNRPGTRFIYPMSLGTDHFARQFFHWPIHEGRDLSWLKNYATPSSVFAVACAYDFFGAYDVDADRGIVQVADHHELSGKKAWTWGECDSGKVAQKNLTDEDGPYVEVQSGPLPTQSDYGMLGPHNQVAWQEWWAPLHGLGDGFEYATRDLAAQTARRGGRLEVRLLATARFPQAVCLLAQAGRPLLRKELDLSPAAAALLTCAEEPQKPIEVTVTSEAGQVLAAFTTPLPIPAVAPPDPARFRHKPDEQLTVEELYFMGRKFDRATDRPKAREYYAKALARDPGHVAALRALAVLDFKAGLYAAAIERLNKALERDGDDGLCWFCLGACRLRQGNFPEALRCGCRAARYPGSAAMGHDLAGRAAMRLGDKAGAVAAFEKAVRSGSEDSAAIEHLMLALHAAGRSGEARRLAQRRVAENPTALIPRALLGLDSDAALARFAREAQAFVGEREFELLDTSLVFAELGLVEEARRLVEATCVAASPPAKRGFLPLYYLAWYASRGGDAAAARRWLAAAADASKEGVFASRPEEIDILQYALRENPGDAQAHLQLGCLLAGLGRVDEAVPAWQKAAELNAKSSIAWRNLALAAAAKNDRPKAEAFYHNAITARPGDQTLYRDLAQLLLAADRRPEAIRLLETMPAAGARRAEITVMLAQAYLDQQRYDDCVKLLAATPYFVNWEGQNITWQLFNRAHVERGRQRLQRGDAQGALADFEAALTYPANLNVGRSNKPHEAAAQYCRGAALAALGRHDEARAAWQAGAAGTEAPGWQDEYRQKCREALANVKL